MRQVEVIGKTLQQAKAEALAQLGVTEDQVEVEVLEETRGFLGILGPQEVRIRVTAKQETRPAAEAPAPAEAAYAPEAAPEPEQEAVLDEALEILPAGKAAEELPSKLQPLAVAARDLTREVARLMGVEVEANIARAGDEEVTIEISGGEDIRLLIGKRGETLDALQLLVAIMANKRVDRGGRVLLDAENYRERRKRALQNMARTQAARAKQTKQEVVVRDLKAYERRVIHLALRDDPEVETYSEGEGHSRNLIISPKTDE